MTGFCQSFIYQMVKDKNFPAPVKIVNSSRWVESEVQGWIHEKLKSRG